MNDLDTLRPEVRSALGAMVRADVCRDSVPTDAFDIIRAELLRLEGECGRLDRAWQCAVNQALENGQRAKRAEAELAALKARIAEAPVATLVISSAAGDLTLVWAENPDDWASKRVRLLVDEPPAERGEG